MAADTNPPQASAQDALPRLNALVDGELSPAERASLAARLATDRDLSRAHATLARLKAAVAATVDDGPAAPMAAVRPRRVAPRTSKGVAFTGIAAALLVAVVSLVGPRAPAPSHDEAQPAHTTLRVATLPADPVVPDLTVAGLKLAGIAMETLHGAPLVVATYRGPRGCRLELRVAPAGVELPLANGTALHRWIAGRLQYELVAFGMPAERFVAVAGLSEQAVRGRDDDHRLRTAQIASPPCVG